MGMATIPSLHVSIGEALLSSFSWVLSLTIILVLSFYLAKLTRTYKAKVKSFQAELTHANKTIQSLTNNVNMLLAVIR